MSKETARALKFVALALGLLIAAEGFTHVYGTFVIWLNERAQFQTTVTVVAIRRPLDLVWFTSYITQVLFGASVVRLSTTVGNEAVAVPDGHAVGPPFSAAIYQACVECALFLAIYYCVDAAANLGGIILGGGGIFQVGGWLSVGGAVQNSAVLGNNLVPVIVDAALVAAAIKVRRQLLTALARVATDASTDLSSAPPSYIPSPVVRALVIAAYAWAAVTIAMPVVSTWVLLSYGHIVTHPARSITVHPLAFKFALAAIQVWLGIAFWRLGVEMADFDRGLPVDQTPKNYMISGDNCRIGAIIATVLAVPNGISFLGLVNYAVSWIFRLLAMPSTGFPMVSTSLERWQLAAGAAGAIAEGCLTIALINLAVNLFKAARTARPATHGAPP